MHLSSRKEITDARISTRDHILPGQARIEPSPHARVDATTRKRGILADRLVVAGRYPYLGLAKPQRFRIALCARGHYAPTLREWERAFSRTRRCPTLGTRTEPDGVLFPRRRGATHLALRTEQFAPPDACEEIIRGSNRLAGTCAFSLLFPRGGYEGTNRR